MDFSPRSGTFVRVPGSRCLEFEIFVQTSVMAFRGLSHLIITPDPSLYAIIEVSQVQLNGFGHRYAGHRQNYRLNLEICDIVESCTSR